MPSPFGESIKAWQNILMTTVRPSDARYMKIRINSLPPFQAIPFDLYVTIGDRLIHYLRAGDQLKAEKILNFEKKAPESFYILSAERTNYQAFVRGGLMSTTLDTKQKALILRESTMGLVE